MLIGILFTALNLILKSLLVSYPTFLEISKIYSCGGGNDTVRVALIVRLKKFSCAACVAVMVAVPAPTMVTVLPLIVATFSLLLS